MAKLVNDYEKSTLLNYPGKRHEGSFLLVGETKEIHDLSDNPYDALKEADIELEQHGFAPIRERVPVLAFGRNGSPEGAASKTEKFNNGLMQSNELGTFPMLRAELSGHDVVWHGRLGQKGGYFAELIATPENPDATVEVWVQFLTTEQLATIHTTEGETYEVSMVPNVSLGEGLAINTIGYTARDASVLLDEAGEPISVEGISRSGHDRKTMTVHEALEYTLGHQAVVEALGGAMTPDEFLHEGENLELLSERKARQAKVYGALVAAGMSEGFRYEAEGNRYFRTDFDSLPRGIDRAASVSEVVILPEQHLAAIRPNSSVVAAKEQALHEKYPDDTPERTRVRALNVLDPVASLRKKAGSELTDPRRAERLEKWKRDFDAHHSNHVAADL